MFSLRFRTGFYCIMNALWECESTQAGYDLQNRDRIWVFGKFIQRLVTRRPFWVAINVFYSEYKTFLLLWSQSLESDSLTDKAEKKKLTKVTFPMGWPLSSVERHVVLKNIYEAYYFLGNFFFFNEYKFVLMIIRFRRLECKLRLKK